VEKAEAERRSVAEKKAAEERAAAIAAANAKGVTAADFEYDINEKGNGIVIKKYKGLAIVVNIPATIEGFPVTEIRGIAADTYEYYETVYYDGVFQENKEITSVTIPDSVTSIGEGDSRTRGAFAGCTSLKSVTLPRNLKTIPSYMFADCRSLETITLPAGLEQIGEGAFANTALKSIALPDRITGIGNGAFSGTGLSSVVLPKNLQRLGSYSDYYSRNGVFYDCTSLESVTFQSRRLSVAVDAFWNCPSLTTLTINENVDFEPYGGGELGPFSSVSWYDGMASKNGAAPITTVNIGPNVTRIGNSGYIPTGKLSIAAKAAINRVGYNDE
jgi:hypothetical protein